MGIKSCHQLKVLQYLSWIQNDSYISIIQNKKDSTKFKTIPIKFTVIFLQKSTSHKNYIQKLKH